MQDIDTFDQLATVYNKIIDNTKKELEDLQNQIALKKQELEDLQQKHKENQIAHLMSVELPKEIQMEVLKNILPPLSRYYLVFDASSRYETPATLNRFNLKIIHKVDNATYYSNLFINEFYDEIIRPLQRGYKTMKKHGYPPGKWSDYGLSITFTTTTCIFKANFQKMEFPRQIGINLLKNHKKIMHCYEDHEYTYQPNTQIQYIYEYDSCTTQEVHSDLDNCSLRVQIRL